jgi:hypothetical protein
MCEQDLPPSYYIIIIMFVFILKHVCTQTFSFRQLDKMGNFKHVFNALD